jgi:Family of unknown function (DUF5681)
MRNQGSNGRRKSGAYTVGYGRPPLKTRFRPGHSGNPKGRPKGSKSAASMARDTLERQVPVTERGCRRNMTVRAVAFWRLAEKALSGDVKALAYLLSLEAECPSPPELDLPESLGSAEKSLQIIKAYLNRRQDKKSG